MLISPFKHDCDKCLWVGWKTESGGRLSNVYICPGSTPTVVVRYSDTPSDYWSGSTGGEKHSIEVMNSIKEE